MSKVLVSLILLLSGSSLCLAQASEVKTKEMIKGTACVKAFVSDPELVRITRREDLEDTLLDLQMASPRRTHDQIFIFEVSNTGNFRVATGEIITVTTTGKSSRLIAASSSGQIYPLYGCGDAENAFSDLIVKARITINTRLAAERFALFHYTLVEDPRNDRLVLHSRELRHKAEDFFFTRFASADAEKKFKVWTKAYKQVDEKLTLGIRAEPTATRFSTLVTYMIGSSDGTLRLYEFKINLNLAGEYTAPEKKMIFPIR